MEIPVTGNSTIIETRCQVPSVLQGENSIITCDFGMDVSRKGRWSALSVQREPFSGLQGKWLHINGSLCVSEIIQVNECVDVVKADM